MAFGSGWEGGWSGWRGAPVLVLHRRHKSAGRDISESLAVISDHFFFVGQERQRAVSGEIYCWKINGCHDVPVMKSQGQFPGLTVLPERDFTL